MPLDVTLSRRSLLAGSAGLVIAVHLPQQVLAQVEAPAGRPAPRPAPYAPNLFVRITPDSSVTVLVKHIEFGQGTWTGLATLVAEELDADWSQMRAEHAPLDPRFYANTFLGTQLTGGSTSIANSYLQMRKVGAAARAMLISAAASAWDVPAAEITVSEGILRYRSGKSSGFGEFAEAAAKLAVPTEIALKDPAAFKLIGANLPRLDGRDKTVGKTMYSIDQHPEGMLVAVVAHPPRFGAKPVAVDAAAALTIPGVNMVQIIPQGVAVLAKSTWAALQARDALKITWDESGAWVAGSDALVTDYSRRSRKSGIVARKEGDPEALFVEAGSRVIEQTYVFPYLAHAAMEPLNCLIRFDGDKAHASFGSQAPTFDQSGIASVLGLPPEAVSIDVQLAGGSFGRRAQPHGLLAREAAECAKLADRGVPVKLIWTREDDMRGGFYRPLYVHRMRASIGADNSITAWQHTIVGQSVMTGWPFEAVLVKNGVDRTSVEGAADLPYVIPNFQCDLHTTDVGIPVLPWRSVGHSHTGYATETFVDILLEKTGVDPVEGRLALLKDKPRDAGVLRAVAEAAGWRGSKGPNGRAFGVAVHKSFNTYVAQIAEVSRGDSGMPKVHKIWCAVDCGVAVNPNIVRAQMESGIGFGLGHALYAELEIDADGRVVQGNFDSYRSLRIDEMPDIEVIVVHSSDKPMGVGEPGVPPAAPAVANAWRALTGVMVARLPFRREPLV